MIFSEREEQAARLHSDLSAISAAIAWTREEVAVLKHEQEASRARDELKVIATSTEEATNAILSASEFVDELARSIRKRACDAATEADAAAIQQQMQVIFGTCNFQDLTRQRISKVVKTLVFIEDRIGEMKVWVDKDGALPSRCVECERTGDDALLKGPALPGAAAVSQSAVDDFFA